MLIGRLIRKSGNQDIYDRMIKKIPTIDNKLLERWYYVADAERMVGKAVIKELELLELVESEMCKRGLL